MSTTLSTNAMVTKLQQKFPIGIQSAQWLDFLNEAFRKINQAQKGGFTWQVKKTTILIPAGAQGNVALPADFDPGKTAFLFGNAMPGATSTLIPYSTLTDFITDQNFATQGIGFFSSWTFLPNFVIAAPTSYGWYIRLSPDTAFPLPVGGVTLGFWYHAVNFAPLAAAANAFFPTPDQFDSLIMDLAEAEARRTYGAAGWDKIAAAATQTMNELIDTYRTDRYNLAGLSDQVLQAQEKQVEGDR